MISKKGDTIIEEIIKRIDEINCGFSKKKTSPKFRIKFVAKENDTLYKHISDYANIKFGTKTKEEDYIVNACVWQEYLVREWLDKINLTEIAPTERKSDIFQTARKTTISANDSEQKKSEKRQCKTLIDEHNSVMGELFDFQVPLKARKAEQTVYKPEHKGELDLVARQDKEMVLIEYKIPDSTEPLLRAVLEAITYFHQIDGFNPQQSKYLQSFNETFFKKDDKRTWCNAIGLAIVVPEIAFIYGHKHGYELIDEYNIKCYTFRDKSNFEDILPISEKKLTEYRTQAEENLQGIYQNSDLIISKMKLI